MRRWLLRFVWQWLGLLALFALGLQSAWLTGQADPWAWGPTALAGLALAGIVARRGALWASLGVAGTALLFCGMAAARWPDPMAATGLVALVLLAAGGGWLLRDRRWLPGGLALLVSLLLLWRGPAQPVVTHNNRPPLAVITALPLFWVEGGAGLAGPVDAPIVTVLRTRFDVRPIDDPAALAGTGARLLLLAQPRAMAPEALVAIDQWVRNGGTVLVLADPLLRWPSALPIGDRRRAPVSSPLDPLLSHWGLAGRRVVEGEMRQFLADGSLITLSGTGLGKPLLTSLSIGRGTAIVLADADLLDDRLWLADPARPLDPRAWSADTPALVANWLGAALPLDRRWMRATADITLAIRWAMIVGTGWAIASAFLGAPTILRTNHENKLEGIA